MIPKVTFTGVDHRVDFEALPRGVEYGVLFSRSTRIGNRYPSFVDAGWILRRLFYDKHSAALHVCGGPARGMLLSGDLSSLTEYVQRIQINGSVTLGELEQACDLYRDKSVITQATEKNEALLALRLDNHAVLVDASGGHGRSPLEWTRPETNKSVGFAGGLNPRNVVAELGKIQAVARGDWWIDMETGVRDEMDYFDLQAVREVVFKVGVSTP